MGKRKLRSIAFTMIEILIVLITISVLAGLSLTTFRRTVDANKNRICQQNLKVLQAAIDVYAVEHPNEALPASLSKLEPRQIYLAYEKVVGRPKENRFLTFLKGFWTEKSAQAQSPLRKYYGYDIKVLRCPADTSGGPVSYSYNTAVFANAADLKDPDNEAEALVADSNTYHRTPGGGNHGNGINQDAELGTVPAASFDLTFPPLDVGPILGASPVAKCCVVSNVWKNLTRIERKACRQLNLKGKGKGACP